MDYALRRRALLADVHVGRTSPMDVCDATSYLLQAAKFHGEATSTDCPMCRRTQLVYTHWVFGDLLGAASGSARAVRELERMAQLFTEFTVYVVEVCQRCHWNHLVQSYVLGSDAAYPDQRGTKTGKRRTAGQ